MHGFDKLELSTETIRDLSGQELRAVAGGARPTIDGCITAPPPPTLDGCFTGIWPTFDGCFR